MQSARVNGARLRAIREERELTGDVLADLVSAKVGRRVDPSTIYKIEKGSRQPGARLFGAICRVLQVERSALTVAAPEESRESTNPPPADVDVQQLRSEERTVPDDVPELRR